jgi:hypothetical protein
MQKIVIRTENSKLYMVDSANLTYSQDMFGSIQAHYNGELVHCETGPAIITETGAELYYIDGRALSKAEFTDRLKIEPVIIQLPGGVVRRLWRKKDTNLNHRTDGPAIETSDGSFTAWMVNGRLHRVGGPASIVFDGENHEECYYYNGKLHNADGPAKINHKTKRSSYYLNGRKISKRDFFLKQKARAKMKEIVAQRVAYSTYAGVYGLFKTVLAEALADHKRSPIQVHSIIEDAMNTKTAEEQRAGAIAIYHAFNNRQMMTEREFIDIYDELSSDTSNMTYVMDYGVGGGYLEYLAVFLIALFDRTSVFTSTDSTSDAMRVINKAVDDSLHSGVPETFSQFSGEADVEVGQQDTGEDHSNIFSWTLPLAIAAGATMLNSLYRKGVAKKSVGAEKEAVKCR